MTTPQDFTDAVTAAGDALSSLATKAKALHYAATDDEDQNIADMALQFASIGGPRWVQRAKDSGDANQLVSLQQGITGVTKDVTDALVDDVVERFLLMDMGTLLVGPFGVVAGLLSPDEMDSLKTDIQDAPAPPAPQELPLPLFLGGGAVAGAVLAFTTSGRWQGAIGGAVVGAGLGWAAKAGLQKLADKLTFRGLS